MQKCLCSKSFNDPECFPVNIQGELNFNAEGRVKKVCPDCKKKYTEELEVLPSETASMNIINHNFGVPKNILGKKECDHKSDGAVFSLDVNPPIYCYKCVLCDESIEESGGKKTIVTNKERAYPEIARRQLEIKES